MKNNNITIFLLLALFLMTFVGLQSQEKDVQYKSASIRGVHSKEKNENRSVPQNIPVVRKSSSEAVKPIVEQLSKLNPYKVSGTTYVVSNTNNSGSGSLRQAILDANASPGLDMIGFAIPGSGVQTISPTSSLPYIDEAVIIDGTTQFGYSGTPLIELNGSLAGKGTNGLRINGGNCVVRGLIINGFISNGTLNGLVLDGIGIVLDVLGGNIIEGNYIGTDATGNAANPNEGSGIAIYGGSSGNLVGGMTSAARNVISGNLVNGMYIAPGSGGGNRVKGNYIGLKANGIDSLGNYGNGIFIDAPGDTIGGANPAERNIIVANHMPGIALDTNAMNTSIQGNYIGFVGGDVAYGNDGNGIVMWGSRNIHVGGSTFDARNLIAGNTGPGIAIMGTTAYGNIIVGNWIGGVVQISTTSWQVVAGNSSGIYIENSTGNTIGGTATGAGNIISQNAYSGILIVGNAASGNLVQGNTIGPSGTPYILSAGNGKNGIYIENAHHNIIGGIIPSAINYISGNYMNGIFIEGAGAIGNLIIGNTIGISPTDPMSSWGNLGDGVYLNASRDTIAQNVIAYNKHCGIYDSTGSSNSFQRNSIYLNDSLGIDLAPRGLTINDLLDADDGPNGLQNFPILDSASIAPTSVRIYGRMNSYSSAVITLEFFKSDTCIGSLFGVGKTYIGTVAVLCDDSGHCLFDVTLPVSVTVRDYITATASDDLGNTSESSRAIRMLDTDGDGILDIWEEQGRGIDWNCDGIIDLDLWKKHASPFHKDIFVEIDRMAGFLTFPDALLDVQEAFYRVPNKYVNNPDGNNGINLHAEFDNTEVPIAKAVWQESRVWNSIDSLKADHFGTKIELEDPNKINIINAKKLVYRYCIFGVQYESMGSSGLARGIPSRDFVVTLGHPDWHPIGGTKDMQAGTFMHELGHTLGLRHGGMDNIQYKPNYYSVMNYLWQIPKAAHAPGSWALNYSPTQLATLDENHLDELHGLSPNFGDYPLVSIPYNRPDSTLGQARLDVGASVDWDGDGDSTGFSKIPVDVNHFVLSQEESPGQMLHGYADWENLQYSVRSMPYLPSLSLHKIMDETPIDEMTPEIQHLIDSLPAYGIIEPISEWSLDTLSSTPIATSYRYDNGEKICGDGSGGLIITWRHWSYLNDQTDIQAQRVNSLGAVLWENNGVTVAHAKGADGPSIVSDGKGGAIIVWVDERLGSGKMNVYAQRMNNYGQPQWAANGISVTEKTNQQSFFFVKSVGDQHGGIILFWKDIDFLYAQRIDSSGNKVWGEGGVPIRQASYASGEISSVIDGGGGAIVCWTDKSIGGPDYYPIFAQRIDPSGNIQWDTDGKQISPVTTALGGDAPSIVDDMNGGAMFAFVSEISSSKMGVFFQRIAHDGTLRWPIDGIHIDTATDWSSRGTPMIKCNNPRNAIIAWDVKYNGSWKIYIFAQKVDTAGNMQWQRGGVQLAGSLARGNISMVSTKNGGLIIFYQSYDHLHLMAQYADSTGSIGWNPMGVVVHKNSVGSYFAETMPDAANGALVVYDVNTSSEEIHIYAKYLNNSGRLGGAIATDVNISHSALPKQFELMQNYPNPFNPTTTIEYKLPFTSKVVLKVYNLLGQEVGTLINQIENAGNKQIVWNTHNRLASGVYFFRMVASSVSASGKVFVKVKKMLLLK
jgi:hypothetical protein